MPNVSIIIPSYNMAHYLTTAVESVLDQTYQDYEIIIIDDGSTDNTPELVQSFPTKVKYIRQENRGLSAVRNRGIELACGEYIIFLDADDVLLKNALEKSVAFLDQNPEVGFCYGQTFTMDKDGHALRKRRPRGPRNTLVRNGRKEIESLIVLDPRNIIHPSATLIRRSCFEKVGYYNTKLRISEDVDMWIRLARIYDVGHLAEPIGIARYHSQSITAKTEVEIVRNAQTDLLESVFQDTELGPIYSHLREKAYFSLCCLLARVAARTGHRRLGLLYSIRGIKSYPKIIFDYKSLSLCISSIKDFIPQKLRRIIAEVLIAIGLR